METFVDFSNLVWRNEYFDDNFILKFKLNIGFEKAQSTKINFEAVGNYYEKYSNREIFFLLLLVSISYTNFHFRVEQYIY